MIGDTPARWYENQYGVVGLGVGMAHPMGERESGGLRLDFDRRLKLEFHGSKVPSDAAARAQARSMVPQYGLFGYTGADEWEPSGECRLKTLDEQGRHDWIEKPIQVNSFLKSYVRWRERNILLQAQ